MKRSTAVSTKRVFVGNLNFRTTEQQLRRSFEEIGPVVSVKIPADPATGRSRGFGFVEFPSEAEAATAIQVFDGRRLAGREITVRYATDAVPRKSESRTRPSARQFRDDEDDGSDWQPRDHRRRRDWRDMRRSKRSL
jgi:RNA recognition motif-containing protein